MSLKDYLSKYFPNGPQGEYEGNPVDLAIHLKDKFGVNVKQEGNLFNFKYDMLAAKFTYELVGECRGHIWKFDNGWSRICNPFDKFFNQHEGFCPLFDRNVFNQVCKNLRIVEKLDGTCIPLWNDGTRWRVSTLGTITPGQVGDYPGLTFDALFWKTLNTTAEKVGVYLDKAYTYIFELCCAENRILTKYDKNVIALLGIRHNEHGTYLSSYEHEQLLESLKQFGGNIRLPIQTPLYAVNVTDYDSCIRYVEAEATNTIYGEYAEGFVLYDGFKPVAKMKNTRYLSLHSVSGGDIGQTRNCVIERFFAGTLDDVFDCLTDGMKEFVEKLKFKVQALLKQINDASPKLVGVNFATQKDYALCVQANVPGKFQAFFFQNKAKLADPKADLDEMFRFWLKLNWSKFSEYWKT